MIMKMLMVTIMIIMIMMMMMMISRTTGRRTMECTHAPLQMHMAASAILSRLDNCIITLSVFYFDYQYYDHCLSSS